MGTQRIVVRVLLVYLLLNSAVLGLWATFAPRNFYDDFPSFGRHWVAVDGPYNHHLVTDVGALFLALAVVTAASLIVESSLLERVVGVAWAVSALPHFLYHLTHKGALATGDYVASVGGLGLQVILGIALVVLAVRSGDERLQPADNT